MRFTQTFLAILPAFVAADFDVWSGTCSTGLGNVGESPWAVGMASTDSEKVCNGCSGGTSGDTQQFGNPCAEDCGDDQLRMEENGDLTVINTGIKIGHCEEAQGSDLQACNGAAAACLYSVTHRCITEYCIG